MIFSLRKHHHLQASPRKRPAPGVRRPRAAAGRRRAFKPAGRGPLPPGAPGRPAGRRAEARVEEKLDGPRTGRAARRGEAGFLAWTFRLLTFQDLSEARFRLYGRLLHSQEAPPRSMNEELRETRTEPKESFQSYRIEIQLTPRDEDHSSSLFYEAT